MDLQRCEGGIQGGKVLALSRGLGSGVRFGVCLGLEHHAQG